MTIEELVIDSGYLNYRDKVSVETMEILDIVVENNLLLKPPFKQASASLSLISLLLMSFVKEDIDNDKMIAKGFYTSINSLCEWAELEMPATMNKKAISNILADRLEKVSHYLEQSDKVTAERMLFQAALASAIGAAYEVNNGGLKDLNSKSLSGFIEIAEGLNKAILSALEDYTNK